MRILTVAAVAAVVVGVAAGCGPALERLGAGEVGVTARDASAEGRTRAVAWDGDAELRWVEGVSISSTGLALPGAGLWRLHYTAPGRQAGLVVTMDALQVTEEARPLSTPEGFTIGDMVVDDTWRDSPEVMGRVLAVRGGRVPENVSMLLVPEAPLQWVVTIPGEARRWRLDARTGEVLTP